MPATPRTSIGPYRFPIICLLVAILAACGRGWATPASRGFTSAGTTAEITTSPAYLGPALSRYVATTSDHLAYLKRTAPAPSTRVYHLVTADDRPVTLTVAAADGTPLSSALQAAPIPLSLTARVGRRGDTRYERRLVTEFSRHLDDLAREHEARAP